MSRSRQQARVCSRCRVATRPVAPGLRTCDPCREVMKQLNAKRREQKREWNRTPKARQAARARRRRLAEQRRRQRIKAGRPNVYELARLREQMVHELAARLGQVPTCGQVMDLTGVGSRAAGSVVRRRALRLRKQQLHEREVTIPYPVPVEWRVPDEWVWDRYRYVAP